MAITQYRDARGVGYTGWVKIAKSEVEGDYMALPVTACSLEKTPGKIIPDNLIHGSSSDEAASQVVWAWGANAYGGDISTLFFKKMLEANFWDWLINKRTLGRTVIASPDNYNVWKYKNCYVSEFTISGNVPTGAGGTPIEVRFSVVATGREKLSGDFYLPTASEYEGFITNPDHLGDAPIPGWRSNVYYAGFKAPTGSSDPNIYPTAWSITVRNNPTTLYVANGERDPKWVKQGIMTVTGTVTLYHPDGVPLPEDSVIESYNKNGALTITIYGEGTTPASDPETSENLTTALKITIPYIVITRYAQPFAAPAAPVVRTVDFTGLGSATEKAIKFE